jgi:hypothetical protein
MFNVQADGGVKVSLMDGSMGSTMLVREFEAQ